jgi:hypothetical protein
LRNHIRLGAAALTLASAALAATTSFAVPRYDGVWSVSIFTTRGDCIASYRYPMRIANGVLMNGGASRSMSPAGSRRAALSGSP